eukprot:g12432.t1
MEIKIFREYSASFAVMSVSWDYTLLEASSSSSSAASATRAVTSLPARAAAGLAGVGLLAAAAWLGGKQGALHFANEEKYKLPAFLPRQGVPEVMVRPGLPLPIALAGRLDKDDNEEPNCVFSYGDMLEADMKNQKFIAGAHVQEGWLYGARLKKGPLAYPTGNKGDIVQGGLICWPRDQAQAKLHTMDKIRQYKPDQPESGFLRRGLVAIIKQDGHFSPAVWYFQAPHIPTVGSEKQAQERKKSMTFANFPLLDSLLHTLKQQNLITPTEIQEKAIPPMLNRRSIVAVAETGSGKTYAYVLPVLHLLKTLENEGDPVREESRPRAVVMVPTRELGEQVTKEFKIFTHDTRLRVRSVLGGTDMSMAKRNVAGQFEVLVATPGRITKLMAAHAMQLDDVRMLILDEADQMLDQGFLPDVERIVKKCPKGRQMAMFSATLSPQVEQLIYKLFVDAEMIRSSGFRKVVPTLTTKFIDVADGQRYPYLRELLKKPVEGGTMIFTNTREQCDKLMAELENDGRAAVYYRGEMEPGERRENLKAFKSGEVDIMVATDLAARGLDLEDVDRVINYHMPSDLDNYLHRVGRTARAGREGTVVNFVTKRDAQVVRRLGSLSGRTASSIRNMPVIYRFQQRQRFPHSVSSDSGKVSRKDGNKPSVSNSQVANHDRLVRATDHSMYLVGMVLPE